MKDPIDRVYVLDVYRPHRLDLRRGWVQGMQIDLGSIEAEDEIGWRSWGLSRFGRRPGAPDIVLFNFSFSIRRFIQIYSQAFDLRHQ